MHLTNLSWHPLKPCMLLKWPNVTVLLDCSIDFSSMNHFLPHIYSKISSVYDAPFPDKPYLKTIKDNYFIEGVPEVHTTSLDVLSMECVDCILVSNWNSLVALPFYTHNTGFRGSVLATDPVLQFGKLMMVELIEYFDRIVLEDIDNKWRDPNVYGGFRNCPARNPVEWKRFYTTEIMEEALESVTNVSFKQTVTIIGNVSITACNSGHHIGSANWLITSGTDRIGYISSSSARTTHTKIVDWEKLREMDSLILTSLSPIVDNDPMRNMMAIKDVVISTLKRGGNVLMPVAPIGGIYDLIDVIMPCIESTTGISLDTPVYFISPVAKSAIAYSNVNAEWLSEERQNAVYVPEDPFKHASYVKSGRLKIYETIFDSFSKDYKTPCVVFCGHPSLRIGDAAHLLEMWGKDSRNALIMTNPDFPLQEAYGPYEDRLSISAYNFPIDTRLDFIQVNNSILPDLKPKTLFVPDAYQTPMVPGRPDAVNLMIQYSVYTPLRYNETLLMSSKRSRKRKIKIHPDVIKKLEAKTHPSSADFGVSALSGYLNVYDDAYELLPARKRVGPLRPRYTGKLTPELIGRALQKRNIVAQQVANDDGSTSFTVEAMNSRIQISADGLSTVIQSSTEHRRLLTDAVTSYLQLLC